MESHSFDEFYLRDAEEVDNASLNQPESQIESMLRLHSDQIFLGMVSMQFRPKIVSQILKGRITSVFNSLFVFRM